MKKRIGIFGSGMVGKALASGFSENGYSVMIGTGQPEKQDTLKQELPPNIKVGNFEETANYGEILVLAVKGAAADWLIQKLGNEPLKGKTILDATNPIDPSQPIKDGVLPYFTRCNESLMERLQTLAPDANFVKCFSCVGAHLMVNPQFGGTKPTMFICGNSETAKSEAKTILEEFGWDYEDMGSAVAARAIEPLAMLWCIPGFRENKWMHALKLIK